MKNMSFSATTEQIRQRSKTVTRRMGWAHLKPGELFCAIEKGQGLKKGEKVNRLAVLRCISNSRQELGLIFQATNPFTRRNAECKKEGFPGMSALDFVQMFQRLNHCTPNALVQRIEFEYVEDGAGSHRGGNVQFRSGKLLLLTEAG